MNQDPNTPESRIAPNEHPLQHSLAAATIATHNLFRHKLNVFEKSSSTSLTVPDEVTIACWPYGIVRGTNQAYNLRDALLSRPFRDLLFTASCLVGVALLLWTFTLTGNTAHDCVAMYAPLVYFILVFTFWARNNSFITAERLEKLAGHKFTRMRCDKNGIYFHSVQSHDDAEQFYDSVALTLYWNRLSAITLVKSSDGQLEADKISFVGQDKSFNIALSNIHTQENWLKLVSACNKWAEHVNIDPAIAETLNAEEINVSFSQLWLEALAAPSNKTRCLELQSQQSLKGGRYIVKRELGSGGQGTAYLCVDKDKQELPVVLKEYLLPVFVSRQVREEAIKTFETEAKLLKSLHHPGIVSLFDFFIEDQRAYLVLEYASGKTLKDLCREEGRLSEAQTCAIGIKLCDILLYLHDQSPPIVHRDFTPDNLILDDYGNVKLIDFMVAQREDGKEVIKIAGKREYIAPEQFRGKATCQSDIYALGKILFFLLTGHSPSVLASSDILPFLPDATPDLAVLVSKATAIACCDRYQNIAEVRQALDLVQKAGHD